MPRMSPTPSSCRWLALLAIAPLAVATIVLMDRPTPLADHGDSTAIAQTGTPGKPLTLRSDIQEANAKTGVVTARGNVQIYYPARQIQATAAQAQYFSRERRIVLSGDVYVLQEGNSLRGETVTYLIDEGRFVALPQTPKQVEAIYLLKETPAASPTPGPTVAPPALPASPFGTSEFSTPTAPTGPEVPPAESP